MELFKNTNFDFLGKKWPFIIASLVLTVAGLGHIAMKGGLKYGIDFTGGTNFWLRFNTEPPVDKIRTALTGKIAGEISVQQITGKPEVLIGTEIRDEASLNQNRQIIEDTLRNTFGAVAGGKLDINNAGSDQLSMRLREPLLTAGVAMSEQELQEMVKAIEDVRTSKGGILSSLSELNGVKGVTPQVQQILEKETAVGPFTILQTEVVGPKIGAELRQKAVLTTLYALAAMLVYIAFRFEWIYGVAAVIAVFHDTLITIGLFSIFDKPITLTVVAALLTLVGYSMNDTIVVFDRIRENLHLNRRESFSSLVNASINQTLSRTILTSGLTLLTAVSLWIFGGEVLNGFSFALVMGILVGTYSSVFIASPILIWWKGFADSRSASGPAAPAVSSASAVSSKQPAPRPRKAARS